MQNYVDLIFQKNCGNDDVIAIIDNNCTRQTTWGELYRGACKVASFALKEGITGVAPVFMPRCVEAIISLLGLGLAGIGVAPLSDHTPMPRVKHIEDQTENKAWTVEQFDAAMEHKYEPFEPVLFEKDEPAYVVYTSGSTGEPKGVMLSNDVVIKAYKRISSDEILDLTKSDIVLQKASFSFVALLIDVYSPLYAGCLCHILPEEARTDIDMTTDYINAHGITALFFSPKHLKCLGDAPSIRVITVGGEKVSNLGPKGYKLINAWGMSETAALALLYDIQEPFENTPIGGSRGDFFTYIVDENGKLADEGELCISGAIASGYYKQEELTKEFFVPNPFSDDEDHKVLLHTGDIVKRLPDGTLLYIDRKDFMININGQRVEPGEAETVLKNIEGMDGVVVKGFNEDDHSYLCAYYVSKKEFDEEYLKEELVKQLPSYMVPSFFIRIDEIPLNANGKVDRKALAAPTLYDNQNEYEEAKTEDEKALCNAFEKVLGIERIGANDDFLRLGGDSVRAMAVVTEANIKGLRSADILEGRTPRKIAELISSCDKDEYLEAPSNLDSAPLTDSQMGIYLECMECPESTMYNIPIHISIDRNGESIEQIKSAIDSVISLHPALLSRIENDCLIRVPMKEGGVCNVHEANESDAEEALKTFVQPFDLSISPLCHVSAILTEEKIHILLDAHHIVCDGTSVSILNRQIRAAIAGESIEPEKVDAFSIYEIEKQSYDNKDESEKYFDALLAGMETDSNLVFDKQSSNEGILPSRCAFFDIDSIDLDSIKKHGITESTFFMGVYAYALAVMTGQKPSYFVAGENGRKSATLSDTVSMLVRIIPVVANIDEKSSAIDFLKELQDQFFETIKHDGYSFLKLGEEYELKSDVSFVYQGDMISDVEIIPTNCAIANLATSVFKGEDKFLLKVEYRNDLYNDQTIERFGRLMVSIADAFLSNAVLESIDLLSNDDEMILNELNNTDCEYYKDETLVDIFCTKVKENPDNTLVVSGEAKYTYGDADILTDKLAAYIHSLGIGTEDVVSVLIHRNEYMVLASLGILKAGAMYQPLDPSYPSERLLFMREDAGSKLLIADRDLVSILGDFEGKVIYTDEMAMLPESEPISNSPKPEDSAVLLYTSGTTGTPKGCMIMHRNITAFSYSFSSVTNMDASTKSAAYASYGFDAHMSDIYPTICNGGEIHIIQDDIRFDLPAVKNYIESNGITHIVMTTQIGRQLATDFKRIKSLKCLLVGGEKLVSFTPSEDYLFINGYGPSECTVMATAFCVDDYFNDIPIGKAIPNIKLYVVDEVGRRVPFGALGELVISGPQVAKGYLNREEQTNKAFVPNSYETNPGEGFERCYKTGDIVRFLEDGNIAFVGRRDMQVKIRGFRIELSEVERVIRQYPGIDDATVIALDDPSGGKCIHAYIVSKDKINIEDLNEFIRSEKPPYMIPAATMRIDKIPLTPNQKVDKRKLPKIERHYEDVIAPKTATQKRIFDAVAGVLGTNNFGIDTDIFAAGLSSIASIKLCSVLADEFDIPVQMRNLKKNPTVRSLEIFVNKSNGVGEDAVTDHPISKTMEGIFAECSSYPGSTFYNIPYLIKISRNIDEEKLVSAIVQAVEAHPYMKTELYVDSDGTIRQHRRPNDEFAADMIERASAKNIESIKDKLVKPFELIGKRLFRISLIQAEETYLFLDFHHIIADGTSISIFIRDIEKAYAGEALKLEEYSGFDVADDEQKARTKEELSDSKGYYESLLEGLDRDFLPLSDRYLNMPKSSGRLISYQNNISLESIKDYCEKNRISMNAFFMSAFGYVLSKYAGNDYSVFTTVYNGRNDSRTSDTFAMLVKTLPVVCNISSGDPKQVVSELGSQLMDSMANDLYSFSEIVRELNASYDVMFIYQGEGFERTSFCDGEIEEVPLKLSDVKMPLALQVKIKGGKVLCDLEYEPALYTEKLMSALLSAFDMACEGFISGKKLNEISLLSDEAEAKIEEYNNTEFNYDRNITITDAFLESASSKPNKTCVVYKDKKLTYAEISMLTGKVARFLMEQGIGRGDVIPILINRDENMVITAHGVLRSGAAYLGLDPTYPSDRLEFMISNSESKYLIADRSLMDIIPGYKGPVLYTDEIDSLPEMTKESEAKYRAMDKHTITPDNDALVIYSSGTTGVPKGSVLQHKAIVAFYQNYTQDMLIDETSNIATYASFGFDGGAQDVLSTPMVGATLYVIPDEIRMDMKELDEFYIRNSITNGFMTTQVGSMFISSTKCKTLKAFSVGGEKFNSVSSPKHVRFFNCYGPSETMCYVNRHRVTNKDKLQPIGKNSRNIKEYIIDENGLRQPFGAVGELCISGRQMGRGYLNNPEKTAEVFVKNPFSSEEGYELMYRTGDIVRMLPDGNYDFVGRKDGQVKIRGFRVELGEVESQIRKFNGVEKAIVTAFDNPAGGKFLAAYIVSTRKIDLGQLKKFIANEKPKYMVPASIMFIDEIPLTSNGKVDLRKLPKPELGSTKAGAEPADEVEENICSIFADVLGVDKVYADDDFFAIGGTSISAIQVIVRFEQLGMEIVYKNLFVNPTAQKLTAFLRKGRNKDVLASDLEKGDGYDYSALRFNVEENLKKIKFSGIGDVLLTGVTGFLGSHVFREILSSTDGKVICVVRSKEGISSEERLEEMMFYYFEDWYTPEISKRVTVIDGNMEEDEGIAKLRGLHFDTIINSAANVKHFAAGDALIKANYLSVKRLIDLAAEKDAKLIQISSLSVCGESVNGSIPPGYKFKETDLNIGQSLENKYIYSKYLAEQAVIDAVSKKQIRGKVIRLGNLMARSDDSQFQINADTNGFLRMFIGFSALGCFPITMMDGEIEFSPIDAVAKAVVLLSGTPDEFTVFHAKNCNTIHFGYFVNAIRNHVCPVQLVEDDEFDRCVEKAFENSDNVFSLGGLLAYKNSKSSSLSEDTRFYSGDEDDKNKRIKIGSDTSFTVKALYRLGFSWPLVSDEYLAKMVEALRDLNIFNDYSFRSL